MCYKWSKSAKLYLANLRSDLLVLNVVNFFFFFFFLMGPYRQTWRVTRGWKEIESSFTNTCTYVVGGCLCTSVQSWQLSAAEIHRGKWGMLGARDGGGAGGIWGQCISDSQWAVMNGWGITGHQQLGGRWSSKPAVAASHTGSVSALLALTPTCYRHLWESAKCIHGKTVSSWWAQICKSALVFKN